MMELEEGEFGELYEDNLRSYSSPQKSLSSPATSGNPNLNNVDENNEQEHKELEECRVLNCSELDLETNLIRVLINSYGLSPIESSGDDKDGDLTDDFAFELESQLIEEVTESDALNVGSMENHLDVIEDLEGFKGESSCRSEEEFDEDNESEDSLVIVLNDDSNLIQVDSDGNKIGIDDKVKEENLNNDLGMEFSGELGNSVGATVGDHSPHSMIKSVRPVAVAGPGKTPVVPGVPTGQCVRPIAGLKLGGASTLSSVLPPNMKVFDINIDNFEEKKWRRPGVNLSDFFNYGLDEDKWKDYCKQMEQLRRMSSMKSKLIIDRESRKINDQDLASKVTANTESFGRSNAVKTESFGEGSKTTNEMPPSPIGRAIEVEISTGKRLPFIGSKPSRFCGSGAIIEIVSQDSIDENDHKREDFKEDLEPLDRGSRPRTVHKNIHGDRILPFPLDGSSQHCIDGIYSTHHQERFRGDCPPRIRGRPDYQWQKERDCKWRLKQPYEDNEQHKRIITKSKALKIIHQSTLQPPTKRTPYHPTTYGNFKVSNEIHKQWNPMRERHYMTSNIHEQDSTRGKDHYLTGSPKPNTKEEADKFNKRKREIQAFSVESQ